MDLDIYFVAIPGLEGRYEINYEGTIRNSKTLKILKPFKRWKYLSVSIRINGKKKNMQVHILNAKTHKERPRPYREWKIVNHIDMDKMNYHGDNLEWTTLAGNTQHYHNNKKNSLQTKTI